MARSLVPALLLLTALEARAAEPRWSVYGAGGVSYFAMGQSNAIPHRLKPVASLGFTHRWRDLPLAYGIELNVVLAGEGYRLVGLYMLLHARLVDGDVFDMDWVGGFGVALGSSPPILASDLETRHPGSLLGLMGLHFQWAVVPQSLGLGLRLASENLSMATLAATVAFTF